MSSVNTLFMNILLHSQCSHTNCVYHRDSRQSAFSHMKLIFTHLIYMTSLNVTFMDMHYLVFGFVVTECHQFFPKIN